MFDWVDTAQRDQLSPSPHSSREVLAWIWYPAMPSLIPTTTVDYLPPGWREANARVAGVVMTEFLTRDFSVVRAHSSPQPDMSPGLSWPVVIMRPGGSALTAFFTSLAEDLASHGYVVVGFDAPYRTGVVVFPDGRVIARPSSREPDAADAANAHALVDQLLPMWSGDAQFVVNQLERLQLADPSGRFKGKLDLQHLGIFGHSFGGATALQFCHDDSRCKAGIDLDGAPFGSAVTDGVTQPFLFLLSDHGDLTAPEPRAVIADMESIHRRLPNKDDILMIRGTNHMSFSDQSLLKSRLLIRPLRLLRGGPDPRRGLAITSAYVHTFFDVHLKRAPAKLLEDLHYTYPEVSSIRR
jgi:dienelactone hydrolase